MKSPQTDIFMISHLGAPLGSSGCRKAVQDHCKELGIFTHEQNTVNPHRLRHSFGTLNIEPLGLGLSLTEISEQLRHANIQITYDTYIAKNPLHKREGYEKRMAKINGTVHSIAPEPTPQKETIEEAPSEGRYITQNEAVRMVQALGLTHRSLQKYALDHGEAKETDGGVVYSEEFITDLATNYFTRAEAKDLLQMTRSTFFDWTKREAVDFILIGKVSLFRKEIVMEKRRAA